MSNVVVVSVLRDARFAIPVAPTCAARLRIIEARVADLVRPRPKGTVLFTLPPGEVQRLSGLGLDTVYAWRVETYEGDRALPIATHWAWSSDYADAKQATAAALRSIAARAVRYMVRKQRAEADKEGRA